MLNFFTELIKSRNLIKFSYFPIFQKFRINGSGNKINVASRLLFSKLIVNGSGNQIDLKKNVSKKIFINIEGNNNKIIINDARDISNIELIIKDHNNLIFIDSNTGIGGARIVCMGNKQSISIGKNCMLSDGIEIWNYDGHSIFDIDNNILNKPKSIIIEDNVWIGRNVSILKGSKIGKGSVIGMNSLISNKGIEQNSLAVGTPVKITKKNIHWSIDRYYE
jgi:acetyltransferase-like isoleucine patch superfamily enzyme